VGPALEFPFFLLTVNRNYAKGDKLGLVAFAILDVALMILIALLILATDLAIELKVTILPLGMMGIHLTFIGILYFWGERQKP